MSRMNRIGRYQVDDVWREEPLGRIVRARVPEFDRAVFIRELVPSPELLPEAAMRLADTFREESRVLGQITHSLVARAHDVGESEAGHPFLVYERPEAASFHPLPEVTRSLTAEAAVALTAQVAGALAFLRSAGIRCSVFTPADVWVSATGQVRLVPLSFSSLALAWGQSGLPVPLVAPELRAAAPASDRSLVYSLAAWLYRTLAPHAPAPEEAAAEGRDADPLWTQNPAVRAVVDETLQAALARDPGRRVSSLAEFAARLHPTEVPRAVLTAPPATRSAPESPPGDDPDEDTPALVRYAGWAAGLALAGGMAGWVLAQLFPPR